MVGMLRCPMGRFTSSYRNASSKPAAAASAARQILIQLAPVQKSKVDEAYAQSLSAIPDGPAKTDGSQCREGWALYQTTGPRFKGTDVPADFHYYNWVDQQNIIGLGKDTPIATGSNSDSLIALNPQTKKWTYFRIPYPLGFYARGLDGRIDDANAGWKGRALYSNYGTHFVWHIEGGKGTKGKIVKFQVRPDPLAR